MAKAKRETSDQVVARLKRLSGFIEHANWDSIRAHLDNSFEEVEQIDILQWIINIEGILSE